MERSVNRRLALSDRITRRSFMRSAAVGGSGLAAAYLVGCDDGGEPKLTPTPAETGTAIPKETAAPTVGSTPTPGPTAPAGAQWRPVGAFGIKPPPRRDHSLVSDGERLLLFGGRGEEPLADLWSFEIGAAAWEELAPGEGPPARFGHNAVFDAGQNLMIVFGGQAGAGFFDDTWAFDLANGEWSRLAAGAAGPSARYGAASAFDPSSGLVMSHGFTNAGRFDDTWVLSGEAWSEVSPAGSRPVERCLMRGAWDGQAGRFLMFGGQTTGEPYLGDLWELRDGVWRELTGEPKPSPRNFYAMAYDDEGGRLVLFGGGTAGGLENDVWVFDSGDESWSQASLGDSPSPRSGHDSVWLPSTNSFVTFGGRDGSGNLNDLWELTLPL